MQINLQFPQIWKLSKEIWDLPTQTVIAQVSAANHIYSEERITHSNTNKCCQELHVNKSLHLLEISETAAELVS